MAVDGVVVVIGYLPGRAEARTAGPTEAPATNDHLNVSTALAITPGDGPPLHGQRAAAQGHSLPPIICGCLLPGISAAPGTDQPVRAAPANAGRSTICPPMAIPDGSSAATTDAVRRAVPRITHLRRAGAWLAQWLRRWPCRARTAWRAPPPGSRAGRPPARRDGPPLPVPMPAR